VANKPARRTGSAARRRSRSQRASAPQRLLLHVGMLDAARLATGLGASAWMRSPWWVISAALYNVFGEPVRELLQDVRREVGPAIGRRLADLIKEGRRRASPQA
jgi:hypothetical protein